MAYQILIVDDDSEFRQEMKEVLGSYRVIEATNGLEALEIIQKPNAIDVVILDIIMPHVNGMEVLRKIKAVKPDLGIIILTGNSSKDFAIEALKGRADDYIEKPFEIPKLLSTIQRIIDARQKNVTGGYMTKMERIKKFIENNSDKKVSLQHVAEEVCLSPKYLSRLFKENTGVGFNEYRLKVKIEKAEQLLKNTDMTIDQISLQLGYRNAESFIRIFEKLTGRTPTQYRQSRTKKK